MKILQMEIKWKLGRKLFSYYPDDIQYNLIQKRCLLKIFIFKRHLFYEKAMITIEPVLRIFKEIATKMAQKYDC